MVSIYNIKDGLTNGTDGVTVKDQDYGMTVNFVSSVIHMTQASDAWRPDTP